MWLRMLSLSGAAGKALALFLYVLLCGIPVYGMLLRRRFGGMPAAVSVYLFFLMFMMVNPTKIAALFRTPVAGEEGLNMLKAMLVGFFYLLLLSWVLIRIATRRAPDGLIRRLIGLVWLTGALLILSVTCVDFAVLKAAFETVPADPLLSYLGAGTTAPADGVLAIVRFVADAVPTAVLLYALVAAARLLAGCGRELFAAENAELARTLAARARTAILVAVGCMLGRASLEIMLAHWATNVSIMANVPLLELIAALASALFARFMERGCAVYRENQMMI